MTVSNHKLYLGMYSFQIKRKRTANLEAIGINDFLSEAYPDEENKFIGFAKDVIDLLDEKAFKNKQNTHGGILDQKSVASDRRYFDILIDGGLTGIEQFIVDEDGNREKITKDKIVGLKFFARFWLPAGNKTAYVFIQRYRDLGLKPLFDEIIREVLRKKDCSIASYGNTIKQTTTKKRLENFLKRSLLRDITIYSKMSSHETGAGDAESIMVKLKHVKIKKSSNKIDRKVIDDALKNHGFTLGNREYEISATYETLIDGKKEEEKTTKLDASSDSINLIPNIIIPNNCIDENGYPIFLQMKAFVDEEIEQIKREANL